MVRYVAIVSLLVASLSLCTEVIGGAASMGRRRGGRRCQDCWEPGLLIRMSSSSIAPQFTIRYVALEGYIGANFTGSFDTLWADAKKYKLSPAGTLYLAEVDSYSLDLQLYLIQPEVGIRIYLLPQNISSRPWVSSRQGE